MKRALLGLILFALLVSASTNDAGAGKIRLVPQPQLGAGIFRLIGASANQDLAWSPNARYLVAVNGYRPMPECWGCEKSYSEILLVDLQSMEQRTLLRTDGSPYVLDASWFPDSTGVAYKTSGNSIPDRFGESWSIGIDGQHNAPFVEFDRKPIWSWDSSKIAAAGFAGRPGYMQWQPTIEVFDIQNDQVETVFQGSKSSEVSDPSWSPDGKSLAFAYGEFGSPPENIPPKNVFILDIKTHSLSRLTHDNAQYRFAKYAPTGRLIALQREVPGGIDWKVVLREVASDCQVTLPIVSLTGLASWAPNGDKLALTGGGSVYIIDLKEFLGPKFAVTGSICP